MSDFNQPKFILKPEFHIFNKRSIFRVVSGITQKINIPISVILWYFAHYYNILGYWFFSELDCEVVVSTWALDFVNWLKNIHISPRYQNLGFLVFENNNFNKLCLSLDRYVNTLSIKMNQFFLTPTPQTMCNWYRPLNWWLRGLLSQKQFRKMYFNWRPKTKQATLYGCAFYRNLQFCNKALLIR